MIDTTKDLFTYVFDKHSYNKLNKYLVNDTDNQLRINVGNSNYIDTYISDGLYNTIDVDIPINNLSEVREFLMKKNINNTCQPGKINSILKIFVEKNRIDVLKCTIEHNFGCYASSCTCKHNNIKNTLYWHACKFANPATAEYLQSHVVEDFAILNGLYIACRRGSPEVISAVIEEIDYHIIDFNKTLWGAVASGNLDSVIIMASVCPGRNDSALNTRILQVAIKHNALDILKFLISRGAKIISIDIIDILSCMNCDCLDTMKLVLSELDEKRINTLFINSKIHRREMVKLLVDAGANIEKYGQNLYVESKKCGNKHLTAYLKSILKKN